MATRPATLSSDLGLVTRFVGIDLLFTTSPLYDPLVTAPDVDGRKVVHVSMFQDDPASDGTDWINRGRSTREFAAFEPYYDWQTRLVDQGPIDSGAKSALDIFAGLDTSDDCWNDFGDPFAQLFCYFDANLSSYVPNYRKADYVAPIFAFNTTAANLGDQFGLLGFADDNWVDGTQSYVFEFDAAEYREIGYGFTDHASMRAAITSGCRTRMTATTRSSALDFDSVGDFQFVWSGDESCTIMSYNDLCAGFSEFDKANMYRWEFAGYLNWANGLLDDIKADPQAWKVRNKLAAAEQVRQEGPRRLQGVELPQRGGERPPGVRPGRSAADQLGIETPTESALRMAARQLSSGPTRIPFGSPTTDRNLRRDPPGQPEQQCTPGRACGPGCFLWRQSGPTFRPVRHRITRLPCIRVVLVRGLRRPRARCGSPVRGGM